jgi:hypothetical protein
MAFDQTTRGRLQKFVNASRELLSEELTRQLQATYGLDPKTGTVADLSELKHLDNRERQTAQLLREILQHYIAATPGKNAKEQTLQALDRLVREQAFTVLNRMAALRMMEARDVLMESIAKGYNSRGFELYKMLSGTSQGETGDAYRNYLFSLFDEFSVDLELLFDRHGAQGRLFPRESALLELLEQINHPEIEHLWAEDETIGWIYQYFNSQEERKKMRKESQAPRNSRELAVRNQFFTPRYVVEFLVDNTLGRIWFDATQGNTSLYDRCQYLLVKPEELEAKRAEPAPRTLRDPRTLKLLDPACGSMHFGLYAFDLFLEIYREAWAWEQQQGPGSLDVSTQPDAGFKPLSQTYANEADYLRDVPRLIIEHNIYGVDIDPRAAQIATLALWLRAQRAWYEAGVKAPQRPIIGQGHVIAAIAPPAEKELRQQFAEQLDTKDAELFEKTLKLLHNLPELGVLLQVEQELPKLIKQVYGGSGNDLFAAQEKETWQQAEQRLRQALSTFTEQVSSSYQSRLFALDALQGLRLIDLTREVFDVVVMNPPFGAVSNGVKTHVKGAYPDSQNDLLGIFVERGLNMLRCEGRLGAITSRTCFFLTSFTEWRKQVILCLSGVDAIADLGQGVMDDAMVEAAAYVLERGANHPKTNVIRSLVDEDQQLALGECVFNHRQGVPDTRNFQAEQAAFDLLPDSPFVYWVKKSSIEKFVNEVGFDPYKGKVRQGLSTSDNFRFVRSVWEVDYKNTIFCYYPADGSNFCRFDDPVLQKYFKWRGKDAPKWAFHVMSGASQPWYSPITVKVNFFGNGKELANFKDERGKVKSVLRNRTASRYMAFPSPGAEAEVLGVCASRLASAYFRFYGEKFEFPNFLVENVKKLPWPNLPEKAKEYFNLLIESEVEKRRKAYQNFEPFHEFVLPSKVMDYSGDGSALAFDRYSLIGEEGERMVARSYGFTSSQAEQVERDLVEAINHLHGSKSDLSDEESGGEDSDFVLDTSAYATEEAHISYLLGCVFGRWDIRFATGERQPESLPDPFAPLPVCPPGMLQNDRGLPANEQALLGNYPLAIAWAGVLVDDEGHDSDIIKRVQSAMHVIWKEYAESVEEEACAQLACKSLRDYFQRPNGFFADHLKRYTKSSRKAPIYWPLSTGSGSYTLWLYYPELTNQTLFTAVNDFLEGESGKLSLVKQDVAALRNKGTSRTKQEEKELEKLEDLEQELADLRDTLLDIAPNYRPNQDDGVQITAAPLWSLFRHKPWQKVLKDTWKQLEKGDYDWAHLALNYWPDRVLRKCHEDRSLAIAHDVEEQFWEETEVPVIRRGKDTGETKLEWQPKDLSEAQLQAVIVQVRQERSL